jgi:DNA-directed RNA polymerase specialized sigma24 family protein
MRKTHFRTATRNANHIASIFHRRCWWSSRDDLYQEALRAMLDCYARFDETRGEWAAYSYAAGRRAAVDYLMSSSAPVSARRKRELIGLHRAPVVELDAGSGYSVQVEAAIDLARIRARLEHLVGTEAAGLLFGIADGWRPREIAESSSVPVEQVYVAVEQAKRVASGDTLLLQLWREA